MKGITICDYCGLQTPSQGAVQLTQTGDERDFCNLSHVQEWIEDVLRERAEFEEALAAQPQPEVNTDLFTDQPMTPVDVQEQKLTVQDEAAIRRQQRRDRPTPPSRVPQSYVVPGQETPIPADPPVPEVAAFTDQPDAIPTPDAAPDQ